MTDHETTDPPLPNHGHAIATPGRDFHERTATAVADPVLQQAMHNLDRRLRTAGAAAAAHPDWKDRAAAVRRETLVDLDGWLDRLDHSLTARGVQVHRASTPADARRIIVDLARARGARTVVKSKSMATEEIDLGNALEQAGLTSVETDLGEYIVQLAGERPSHMITPAIHKTLPQIRDVLAKEAGFDLAVDREALTAWARERLRGEFLRADIGITGVNFAAADTGTLVLVTNEGNGRFCTTLPRVHVAVMPVEKVIPRLADVGFLLPLLTTHATGQALSNYVTMISGPRRAGEVDGPDELHVVFLDNRRRTMLGTKYEEMLACIRCGACLNVCPVYRNVSGHAYDSVYSGPMGKVLTPLLSGGAEGSDLPYGSTLCHACSDACPVKIPLGDMILALRADVPDPHSGVRKRRRLFWSVWARAWSTPRGYRLTTALGRVSRGRVPGLRAWTSGRDLPPSGARTVPRSLGRGTLVIETLVTALHANTCTVSGPMDVDDARALIVDRVSRHTLVACNADVPIPGVVEAIHALGIEILAPENPDWTPRLADVGLGITGAFRAVAEPAAIAIVAAPGSPRATSLVPPEHLCVLRVADIVPTLVDAMQEIATGEMPSGLTWIGGPSRTGDLEMITTLGVHGPRAVEVLLLG